jgi:ribulose-phosphate 3-epimerase
MTGGTVDISASIMCGRVGALADEVRLLAKAGVDSIHVDIMDGHFVPNLLFGPEIVRALDEASDVPLHAHLMVTDPGSYVAPCAEAGTDVFIFHIEAEPFPIRLMERVADAGMTPGIAVNPATPLTFLRHVCAPYLLIMSVEPGFAGQKWVPSGLDRVAEARSLVGDDVVIGVDGNVSPEKAELARDAGASLFVCGTSSVFRPQVDYVTSVAEMRSRLGANA